MLRFARVLLELSWWRDALPGTDWCFQTENFSQIAGFGSVPDDLTYNGRAVLAVRQFNLVEFDPRIGGRFVFFSRDCERHRVFPIKAAHRCQASATLLLLVALRRQASMRTGAPKSTCASTIRTSSPEARKARPGACKGEFHKAVFFFTGRIVVPVAARRRLLVPVGAVRQIGRVVVQCYRPAPRRFLRCEAGRPARRGTGLVFRRYPPVIRRSRFKLPRGLVAARRAPCMYRSRVRKGLRWAIR